MMKNRMALLPPPPPTKDGRTWGYHIEGDDVRLVELDLMLYCRTCKFKSTRHLWCPKCDVVLKNRDGHTPMDIIKEQDKRAKRLSVWRKDKLKVKPKKQ